MNSSGHRSGWYRWNQMLSIHIYTWMTRFISFPKETYNLYIYIYLSLSLTHPLNLYIYLSLSHSPSEQNSPPTLVSCNAMLEVVDLLEWSPNWHNLFFTQHLRQPNIVYSGFDCLFWLRCMPLIFVEHHPDKPQHKTTCFLPTAAQPLFVSESKPQKTCYNCHNVRYMRQIGRFVSFSFSSCNIAWNTNAWTLKPGPVRTQKQKQSEYVLQRLRKPLFLCNGNPLPTTLFFHCRPYLLAKCSLLAPPRFLLKPRSYWNFCLLSIPIQSMFRKFDDPRTPMYPSSHHPMHHPMHHPTGEGQNPSRASRLN